MDEEYIRKRLTHIRCAYCGQQFTQDNIDLLEHEGDLWYFSVYCQSCKSKGIMTATMKNREVLEADAELTKAETGKFSTPVCLDDVLDIHTFLKDFGGDFSALFSNEQPVS